MLIFFCPILFWINGKRIHIKSKTRESEQKFNSNFGTKIENAVIS